MIVTSHLYEKIISIDNLLNAWNEFIKNKKHKQDVRIFAQKLLPNVFNLRHDLLNFTYKHGKYQCFHINDPKARTIHKALVKDRLLHHAIYRVLYPIFDHYFIYDSYSCRKKKGTHRAVKRLENFSRKVSKNYKVQCFALKCDIKKFFDTIDHQILFQILAKKIKDDDTLFLLKEIINSFSRLNCRQQSLFDSLSVISLSRERERETICSDEEFR